MTFCGGWSGTDPSAPYSQPNSVATVPQKSQQQAKKGLAHRKLLRHQLNGGLLLDAANSLKHPPHASCPSATEDSARVRTSRLPLAHRSGDSKFYCANSSHVIVSLTLALTDCPLIKLPAQLPLKRQQRKFSLEDQRREVPLLPAPQRFPSHSSVNRWS